jgi:ferredoxin
MTGSASASAGRRKQIKALLSRMNKQNERFIVVAPPLIDMMDMTIEDQELDFLLQMGTGLKDFDQVRKLSNLSDDRFSRFFDTLKRKGLVHIEFDPNGNETYRLNAIAVGWYEAMMHYLAGKPGERAFSEKFQDYFKFFKKFNFPPLRHIQNAVLRPVIKPGQGVGILDPALSPHKKKTIPIHADVASPESRIYPTSFVSDLIREWGDKDAVCVFPCVCRHGAAVLDNPCRHKIPQESCIAFGDMADAWVGYGYGRKVSTAEALDILKAVRDRGAIHSVIHEKDDTRLPAIAICNCCWDCCDILKPYNMGAVPLKYQRYFVARIKDAASCKGCGKCERYCPTTAIALKDKQVSLNPEKCIGCGQCAYQCVQNNIELCLDPRPIFLPTLKPNEVRIR